MTNSDIIEARVIACLANHLSCRVAAEVPEDFPADAALVVVSRLGERRENHLRRARLAVQSYGRSLLDAAARCEAAERALYALPAEDAGVSSCRVETSYNFTDETTKRYRYQSVVHVTYYEED